MSQPLTQETKTKLLDRLNECQTALTHLHALFESPSALPIIRAALIAAMNLFNRFIHTLPGILVGANNKDIPFFLIHEVFVDLDVASGCIDTNAGATNAPDTPDRKKLKHCLRQMQEAKQYIEQLMQEPWEPGDPRLAILQELKDLVEEQYLRAARVNEGESPDTVNMSNNGEYFGYLILTKKHDFLRQMENFEQMHEIYNEINYVVRDLWSVDEFILTKNWVYAKHWTSEIQERITKLRRRVENTAVQ